MKKEGLLYRVKNAATALFGGTKFTSAVILQAAAGRASARAKPGR